MDNPEIEYNPRWFRILHIPGAVFRLTYFCLADGGRGTIAEWWKAVKWTVGVRYLPADGFKWLMEQLDKEPA